ncbi:hypothetical protein LDENG_00245830, partial [Lucifuga dentata]
GFSLVLIDDITLSQCWLPSTGSLFEFRIEFKILLITFKALLGLAPSYITEMLTPYESVRSLRYLGGMLLAVPKSRLKSKGDRAFAIRALLLWNDLPE